MQNLGNNPADVLDTDEPFHHGERLLQQRFGAREQLAGSRAIRADLPTGFQHFLAGLDYLVLGFMDDARRPWATMLFGRPGFAGALDATHLSIAALPAHDDPARAGLQTGAAVAILAIDLARRGRIRINGRVVAVTDGSITIEVRQAFGNCPQYIWPRVLDASGETVATSSEVDLGDDIAQRIIDAADTFFITSRFARADGAVDMDVSHRGGPAGFVQYDGGDLLWPDYRGNFYFNTLGNLILDPACGLLIPGFGSDKMLMLTGTASVEGFDGQIRPTTEGIAHLGFVRFKPTTVICRRSASLWHLAGAPAIIPKF